MLLHLFALVVVPIAVLSCVQGLAAGVLGIDGGPLTVASLGPSVAGALHRRRGRPRKFAAPSRAVTLTLPESVIHALSRLDGDISRAVVRLTRRASGNVRPSAELAVFGRRAVITVEPRASLAKRTEIELVPLPDGRALISFDEPHSIAELELRLSDALDDKQLSEGDRQLFLGVLAILRDARRSDDVKVLQRSIIVLEAAKRPLKAVAATGRAKVRS